MIVEGKCNPSHLHYIIALNWRLKLFLIDRNNGVLRLEMVLLLRVTLFFRLPNCLWLFDMFDDAEVALSIRVCVHDQRHDDVEQPHEYSFVLVGTGGQDVIVGLTIEDE